MSAAASGLRGGMSSAPRAVLACIAVPRGPRSSGPGSQPKGEAELVLSSHLVLNLCEGFYELFLL